MLFKRHSLRIGKLEATMSAIDRSQAVIEFDMAGTIVRANDNFLRAMGYTLEQIHRGRQRGEESCRRGTEMLAAPRSPRAGEPLASDGSSNRRTRRRCGCR